MPISRVLVIEPESDIASLWCDELRDQGFDAVPFASDDTPPEHADAVIVDLWSPRAGELVGGLRRSEPALTVIAVSAEESATRAVEAMRFGACDFFVKPISGATLVAALRRAERRGSAPAHVPFAELVGDSAEMKKLRDTLTRIADSTATVLVTGESGTGKELVARALHEASARRAGPFVAINCAAIPESLLESELFGHVKGAFSGATQARVGRLETASGGTLFLDEVGDMPLSIQVKLLRVLQERVVEPVGGNRSLRVDVRVIAATHQNLEDLVAKGSFREDLYYRLNVIPVSVPALRHRLSDLPALCSAFLTRANESRSGAVTSIDPSALDVLRACRWRGNVRELQNLIERLVVLKRRGEIGIEDLPASYRGDTVGSTERDALFGGDLPESGLDLRRALLSLEGMLIGQAMQRSGGNKNRAATLLGLNRTTLVEKLKRMAGETA
jgi:DNA-binding NtrC family response regulator